MSGGASYSTEMISKSERVPIRCRWIQVDFPPVACSSFRQSSQKERACSRGMFRCYINGQDMHFSDLSFIGLVRVNYV